MPARKIMRSIHEASRDRPRDVALTGAYVTIRGMRKKVEMLFAHLKRILKLDRLCLPGPNEAKDEFLSPLPPKPQQDCQDHPHADAADLA